MLPNVEIGFTGVRRWLWPAFLVVGLIVAVAAARTNDDAAIQPAVNAAGFATAAATVFGVWLHRPARRLPWLLVAASALITTVAMGVLPRTTVAAEVAELLLGIGYLTGFWGYLLLVRGRMPGGDRGAFLDAAIIAAGAGVLIWAFGLAPYMSGGRESFASSAFFFIALIASGTVIRLWLTPGPQRPTTRLLVLLVLASNAIILLQMFREITGDQAISGPYHFAEVAALAFIGAAALHPSMAISDRTVVQRERTVGRRRLVALTGALLVNPATLAIAHLRGGTPDPAPYLVGGVLIGVLVVARLGEVLRELGDSLQQRDLLTDQLRHQAMYDALTDLPNRVLLEQLLLQACANPVRRGRLAVLLIDLDGFKDVNDSYGHAVGDAVLVAVAGRIQAGVRAEDTAARLGGDEFIVVLSDSPGEAHAADLGRRLIDALGQPYEIGDLRISVSASVGVAVNGPDAPEPDEFMRRADVAMYDAKARGKGRLVVYESPSGATPVLRLTAPGPAA